jgi:hypothetical protein
VLAEGKGVRREAESEGSRRQNVAPMNKNRIGGTETEMRRPTALKSDTYTDGLYVYAAVISVEVRVHYPGRSAMSRQSATATERWPEGIARSAEGIVKPGDRPKAQR